MAAFLLFIIVVVAAIVAGIAFSVRLYRKESSTYHSPKLDIMTLSQEAMLDVFSYRKENKDTGMRECAYRLFLLSLVIMSTFVALILLFVYFSH